MPSEARTDEIRRNLAAVEARLDAACSAAGRRRDELTLVAITKTFPADDVRRLVRLGVTDIGENRDQEAAAKASALSELPIHWHFVGQLQTNKARSVAHYADVVHSVDRPRLVHALSAAAEEAGRVLDAFVQISLEPTTAADDRGGVQPDQACALADAVADAPGLTLAGVMAVAPLGADPADAFHRLADVAAQIRADHPTASAISAGMSGDLEAAVANGATHVRIGTALLGVRPPRFG